MGDIFFTQLLNHHTMAFVPYLNGFAINGEIVDDLPLRLSELNEGKTTHLDLRQFRLGEENRLSIVVTCKYLTKIESLDLSCNGLESIHVDEILRLIRACSNLKTLRLEVNNLGLVGTIMLLRSLSNLKIYLQCNRLLFEHRFELYWHVFPDLCPTLDVCLDADDLPQAIGYRTSFWAFFSCSYGFGSSPAQSFFELDGDKRIQHKIWEWLQWYPCPRRPTPAIPLRYCLFSLTDLPSLR
jgi:hypothetical protein